MPTVDISDTQSRAGGAFLEVEPQDYPLFGAHGEPTSEEIRLQVIVVSTSRTPRPLSILAGTWNVGNAPPDSDLGSWLPAEQVWQADVIVIGAQVCMPKEPYKRAL